MMPYTPQQNEIAECRNRTLLEMTELMLSHTDLPVNFWGEALSIFIHVINRITTKSRELSLYEYWNGRKPCLFYLKIWCCKAYVLILKPLGDKLENQTYDANS